MTGDRDPLADLPWPEPVEEPRAETSEAIHRAVTENLTTERGLGATTRLGLSIVVSIGVVVVVALIMGGARPAGTLRGALFGALGWGVVQAAILFIGLAQPPGKRLSRNLRLGLVVAIPIAFIAVVTVGASHWLPLAEFFGHAGHQHGVLACGGRALLSGAVAAGAVLLLFRRTDPMSPEISGAIAGVSGGLAGAVAIGMACPSDEAWHLSIGHGLVVALLALGGWLVGRKWLTP